MTLPRKFPVSKQIMTRIRKTTAPSPDQTYLVNRNPRNLEFLRIANKPLGYKLDKQGRSFWNKLVLTSSGKHVTAQMVHFEKGAIIEASTKEWAIKKQLYKTSDTCAFINLGKVFAQRCLESGFIEMKCDLEGPEGGKVDGFLKAVKDSGVVLTEPDMIRPQLEVNPFVGRKQKPYGDWEA